MEFQNVWFVGGGQFSKGDFLKGIFVVIKQIFIEVNYKIFDDNDDDNDDSDVKDGDDDSYYGYDGGDGGGNDDGEDGGKEDDGDGVGSSNKYFY